MVVVVSEVGIKEVEAQTTVTTRKMTLEDTIY